MAPSARTIAIRLVIIMVLCGWYLMARGQDIRPNPDQIAQAVKRQVFLDTFSFAVRCLAIHTPANAVDWTPGMNRCVKPLADAMLRDGVDKQVIVELITQLGQKAREERRK